MTPYEERVDRERQANVRANQYFGEVGQRVDVMVTVNRAMVLPDDPDYGPRALNVLDGPDRETLKWFTSHCIRRNAGDQFLARFTIKAHRLYQGRYETLISRLVISQPTEKTK